MNGWRATGAVKDGEEGRLSENGKCARVQTWLLCAFTWEYTSERREKENDTGRQGCKSKKTRTKGRTEGDGGAVWVRWL